MYGLQRHKAQKSITRLKNTDKAKIKNLSLDKDLMIDVKLTE